MRLSRDEFFAITPRQFHLLWDRRREDLLHRELCHAYTSAAVYNLLGVPEERIPETAFMPNHRASAKGQADNEQEVPLLIPQDQVDDYRSARANVAALLEAYRNTGVADPRLIALGLVKPHE